MKLIYVNVDGAHNNFDEKDDGNSKETAATPRVMNMIRDYNELLVEQDLLVHGFPSDLMDKIKLIVKHPFRSLERGKDWVKLMLQPKRLRQGCPVSSGGTHGYLVNGEFINGLSGVYLVDHDEELTEVDSLFMLEMYDDILYSMADKIILALKKPE